MKVLVVTVADEHRGPGGSGIDRCAWEKLLECARKDRFGEHTLTDDPAEADLIVFAEMGTTAVLGFFDARLRRHPHMRRYPEKCFVMKSADLVIPYLPGIYSSVERRAYDERRVRSMHYLSTHISEPPLMRRAQAERDLLFSFVGNASNDAVRQAILGLRHPRGLCRDVSEEANRVWAAGGAEVDRFLSGYADVMSRSRFALCPRGLGASSMRLFESMRFGVAPVVISDQWVPPTGPDWDSFSVRVGERDVALLPSILESHEGRSEEMGRAARIAWEEWFSDEVSFHRVVGWCNEIRASRGGMADPTPGRLRAHLEAFRPVHLRTLFRDLRAWARGRGGRGQERMRECESS